MIKATGAKGLTKEESPFYNPNTNPKHFTSKNQRDWKEKDYQSFKLSPGTINKQKNPLSKPDLPGGRFGGLRNDRKWTDKAYREFKKIESAEDASPFQSMKDATGTPRTRVQNQYQRNGRVGDFGLSAAQRSFLENQQEAKRIQLATNGHGGGGAGEAIFGGGKQPGAVSKRKMKGAAIFIDGVPDQSGH